MSEKAKTALGQFAEMAERLAADKVRAELKTFLQEFALLRALEFTSGAALPWPEALSMPCPKCVDEPTTTWKKIGQSAGPGNVGTQLTFKCVHCSDESVTYWTIAKRKQPHLVEGDDIPCIRTVRKIGQWPAWSITPANEVRKALQPSELELYQKALANLAQGYGLGALAYLRRLLESRTEGLLDMIEEAARLEGNAEAVEGIKKARSQRDAEERLRLAATVLPISLRPAGQNPLDALYSLFSAGLHGSLSEDECLEIAASLRAELDYVFTRMRRNIEEAKQCREGIERARELAAKARKKKEGK